MRRPAPLPAELAGRAFRVMEAREFGISQARARRADLTAPLWGVRSPAAETGAMTFRAALCNVACVIADDEAFSHVTAARILELPLPTPWTEREPWHITGENDLPRLRRRQVQAHGSVDPRDVVVVQGFRCTHPVVTWADLATTLSVDDLVVLGDGIIATGLSLTVADLAAMVRNRAGHRGVVRMREALRLVRVGSRSAMETRARLMFRRGGLPEPELNAPVFDEVGEWLAYGDFVWRRRRVVAEFDGDHHRTDRRQWEIDVARREAVQAAGWTYVQLTARSVNDPAYSDRLLARLRLLLG